MHLDVFQRILGQITIEGVLVFDLDPGDPPGRSLVSLTVGKGKNGHALGRQGSLAMNRQSRMPAGGQIFDQAKRPESVLSRDAGLPPRCSSMRYCVSGLKKSLEDGIV
jgi:hypothetical protein